MGNNDTKLWDLGKVIGFLAGQCKVSITEMRTELAKSIGVGSTTIYGWVRLSKAELRKTIKYEALENILLFAKERGLELDTYDIITSKQKHITKGQTNIKFG